MRALTGIDPDHTREVDVYGAKFTIGVIDSGVWERINNDSILAYEGGLRRSIKRLADEGIDPEEVVKTNDDGSTVRKVDTAAWSEPKFRERLVSIMEEAAKYSIRGHSGFQKPNGEPVPFEMGESTSEGRKIPTVGVETLRWYRQNTVVLFAVWVEIKNLMNLGSAEKKG